MMSQWWVRRSSSAVVILGSLKTLGHSPNARFVVTGGRIDRPSQVMHGRIRFEACEQHIKAGRSPLRRLARNIEQAGESFGPVAHVFDSDIGKQGRRPVIEQGSVGF
jgi:hypothetical protein